MEKITKYKCSLCGKILETEDEARGCEDRDQTRKNSKTPRFQIGEIIRFQLSGRQQYTGKIISTEFDFERSVYKYSIELTEDGPHSYKKGDILIPIAEPFIIKMIP